MSRLRSYLIALLFIIVAACAHQASQVATVPSPAHEVQDIRFAHTANQTDIVVEGLRPLIYTSFRLTNPDRFVVDIAEIGLGRFTEKMVPASGLVKAIQPRGGVINQGSQFEVILAEATEASVRTDGTHLIIEIVRSAPRAVAAPTPTPATPASTPVRPAVLPMASSAPEVNLPPARFIKNVRFDKKGGLQLIVTADGLLAPRPDMVDAGRLVIDLPNIKPAMKLRTLSVSDPIVKQLRMGQHPDKVRLVLDLAAPAAYAFRQNGNDLIVYLRAAKEGAFPPDQTTGPVSSPTSSKASVSHAPAVAVVTVIPTPSATPDSAPAPPKVPVMETKASVPVSLVVPSPTPLPTVEDRPVVTKTASVETRPRYTGKKVSLDFQEADVVNVLRLLGDVSESNMVISDDVKGKVNLKLANVPWDQALDIILKSNNLGQVREENIIRIGTLVNMTRQQDEELKAKETRDRVEDLAARIITINYSKAKDLAEPLKKSLSPRGDITVDDRTNTLIVKDIEKNLVEVARLVGRLDTPTPQVTIEARIVQVLPSFSRGLGIQWGANYSDTYKANRAGIGGVTFGPKTFGAPAPDFAVNLPASPTFGGVGISFGRLTSNPFNLDLRLSAGESQGLTRIVSRPKVTVLDNQEAKISQGEQVPYQTISNAGTQTIFKDATLSLTVIPRISPDGGVMMKINVTKDSLGAVSTGAGPSILKKEASTNVLVRDGETTVIGGIYEKSHTDSEDGLPFLRKIPGLGWLFKTVQTREAVSELLVFLTPRIVKAPVTKE